MNSNRLIRNKSECVLACVCDRDNIASHLNEIGSICSQMWHNGDTITSFNCNHIDWPAWWINSEVKRLHGLSLSSTECVHASEMHIIGKRIHVWPNEQFFFLRRTKGTDFPMNIKITNIYQLSNDLACPSQFLHHQSHSEIFGLLNVISRVHTHCIAYSHHGIPLLSTTVDKSNKSTRNVSDDFSHSLTCLWNHTQRITLLLK